MTAMLTALSRGGLAQRRLGRRLLHAAPSQTSFHAAELAQSSAALAEAKRSFRENGFVKVDELLSAAQTKQLGERFEDLFAGRFETGVYPDEWHWRAGISRPEAFREIVNGWKADSVVAKVATAPHIGQVASALMGWAAGARLGQDDVLWKPPLAKEVGFHQDAAYISTQFDPLEDNSVTVWIALDDADQETGVVEYCPGSHRWPAGGPEAAVDSAFHGEADYRAPLGAAAARAGCADPEVVSLSVPAGSAVFHHQDVWHGSASNVSETRHRRALGLHLLRRDVKWRTTSPPDYIYGRYVLPGEREPRETFFPTVYKPAGN